MTYRYFKQWNSGRIEGSSPLSEEQARGRYLEPELPPEHWFTVVPVPSSGWRDGVNPTVYLEVVEDCESASVSFLSAHGSIELIYDFQLMNDSLFLGRIIEYEYPRSDIFQSRVSFGKIEIFEYTPAGDLKVQLNNRVGGSASESEYRNVDVSDHWEPIPEFGDWESLMRRDRWPSRTSNRPE